LKKSSIAFILGLLAMAVWLPSPLQAGFGVGRSEPKYKIRWLIGHPSTDFFEEAAANFKKTVESKSHGEISVEIVTNENQWEDRIAGTPGPEIAEQVASGKAEMGHSFTDIMGGMDHKLWAFDLPYLFRDNQHLEQVFEGPIGAELLAGLSAHQMVGLAFTYSGGANFVSTRGRAITSPADLKGLRVAVFGDDVDNVWLTSLGAIPVSIKHRENQVKDLSKEKSIDAAMLTWRRNYRLHLGKIYDHGSLEGATNLVSVTYINEKFFNSLPEEYRALIASASREAGRVERAETIELNARCKRRLLSAGMKSVELTAAQRRAFEEALRPVYANTLNGLVGKELIERIRNTGAEEGRVSSRTP
jgi:TRAP-type C4-dicarboxylate transport system substrate-binding protein